VQKEKMTSVADSSCNALSSPQCFDTDSLATETVCSM